MRRRQTPLTAVRVRDERQIEIGGDLVRVHRGDWLITRGAEAVDWTPSHQLDERYEIVAEGGLTLPPLALHQLEAKLGIGSIRDPLTLTAAVERLARIAIGSIEVPFTPGQFEEIRHRAAKRGHTVEQELRAAVDRVKDEIFHRG